MKRDKEQTGLHKKNIKLEEEGHSVITISEEFADE